jgi:hypothetical protein
MPAGSSSLDTSRGLPNLRIIRSNLSSFLRHCSWPHQCILNDHRSAKTGQLTSAAAIPEPII